MEIFEHSLYKKNIEYIANLTFPWEKLSGSTILITGATGQIGSMIIDVLMYKNEHTQLNCSILALGRNEQKMKKRFSYCFENPHFKYIYYDFNNEKQLQVEDNVDYIFHLASNTHPLQYSTDPISTISTNVIGLKNLLDFATEKKCKRFVFTSSNEIYGENRGDVEKFDEDYCGYINCNSLRAGYPESKRCGEALCQAYIRQSNLDIVIPRVTRTFGPTLLKSDTKVISQFILNAIHKKDIVLKSEGNQYFSFLYIVDTITGIFTVFFNGENGNAYNIADEKSDIKIKDLANYIANSVNTKVVFELPNIMEKEGFSKVITARLSNEKIQTLGWKSVFSIYQGIDETIKILTEI